MDYSVRRTGKTFRVILKTLLAASEGESVVFGTNHKGGYLDRFLIPRVLDILTGYGIKFKFINTVRVIRIEGGGSILFQVYPGMSDLRVHKTSPRPMFMDFY